MCTRVESQKDVDDRIPNWGTESQDPGSKSEHHQLDDLGQSLCSVTQRVGYL